jgi:hypothetical protein
MVFGFVFSLGLGLDPKAKGFFSYILLDNWIPNIYYYEYLLLLFLTIFVFKILALRDSTGSS